MSDSESEVHEPVDVGLNVQYCGACTMPLEYCEYSPLYKTGCMVWRRDHGSDSVPETAGISKAVENLSLDNKQDEARPSSKPEKSSKKGKSEQPKGPVHILISPLNRKNKIVTIVQNMGKLTDEKKVAKALSSKFACGASILKGPPPGIYIQGDVSDDLPEFLVQKFLVPEEQVFFLDLKKNKESPSF